MNCLNQVTLLGTLASDPEIKYTAGGTAVCNVLLRIEHQYKDREGVWKTKVANVPVTVWGKRGETVASTMRAGEVLMVAGSIVVDEREGRNGGAPVRFIKVEARELSSCVAEDVPPRAGSQSVPPAQPPERTPAPEPAGADDGMPPF